MEGRQVPEIGLGPAFEPLLRFFRKVGAGSTGGIIGFLVLLIWIATGVYMVGPGESGIVLTFGKVTAQTAPGLRFRIPWPIQSHAVVDIARVRRAEIGFRERRGQTIPVKEESLMLSGDENIVDLQLIVQYLVRDPVQFMFRVRDAQEILHSAAEVALRRTVGQNTIDFTMTEGRVEVQDEVRRYLQELLDHYGSGLQVTEARLLVVDPPEEVRDAFHDVVRAWEDRERLIREAEGYQEEVVPRARGESAQMVLEAEAYRGQRLIRAQGDAERFLALLAEYRKAPVVTRERLYLESMERVLPATEKIILDTSGAGSAALPLLPLRGWSGPGGSGKEADHE